MKKPPQSNEVDVSSESGSDASTSIDSSSDEGSKKESGLGNTEWSLDKFVKPDIQPKPVPAELTESNGSLASADSSSHKFTSPKRIKDQNKQNPNGIRYFPHQGRILNWFYFHQIISLLLICHIQCSNSLQYFYFSFVIQMMKRVTRELIVYRQRGESESNQLSQNRH